MLYAVDIAVSIECSQCSIEVLQIGFGFGQCQSDQWGSVEKLCPDFHLLDPI